MASRYQTVTHMFDGGWATDFGENSDEAVSSDGKMRIPFLTVAENIYYELDGAPHKIGGSQKFVPSGGTPLESGATVTGVFDYWTMDGTPSQRRVAHVGTKLWDLDNDLEIVTPSGLTADAIPDYTTFDDKLIVANDSTDVPGLWDQSSYSVLSATAPNFAFSTVHKLRMFAAGVSSNPSRLYYSATQDATDWTSTAAGYIDINPGDGDKITGIVSFRNELWIFKGPHKGSIHRLQGSSALGVNGGATSVGQDAFALVPFVDEGIGAVGHRTVFRMGNDVAFMWSDGSFHTLTGTDVHGDLREGTLSRPINNWLRDHVVHNRLEFGQSVVDTQRGYALTTLTIDSGSTNNAILMLDYRFELPRWAYWPAESMACLGRMIDSTNNSLPVIFGGGYDGYTWKLNGNKRNINTSTAITAKAQTPFMNYGQPFREKQFGDVNLTLRPAGGATVTLGWKRDDLIEQTRSLTQQQGGDRLATAVPATENFTLDTSTLGGSQSRDIFFSEPSGGEFRRIRLSVSNGELNRDMEVHAIGIQLEASANSTEAAA